MILKNQEVKNSSDQFNGIECKGMVSQLSQRISLLENFAKILDTVLQNPQTYHFRMPNPSPQNLSSKLVKIHVNLYSATTEICYESKLVPPVILIFIKGVCSSLKSNKRMFADDLKYQFSITLDVCIRLQNLRNI